MPKAKPDEVIVHRIELQQSERDMLETAIGAYSMNQVMEPLVEILKDVSAIYALITLYELITGKETGIPTPADVPEWINTLRDHVLVQNAIKAAEAGIDAAQDPGKIVEDLWRAINPFGRSDVAQGYSYWRPEGWAESVYGGGQAPILNPDGSEWQPGDPRPY